MKTLGIILMSSVILLGACQGNCKHNSSSKCSEETKKTEACADKKSDTLKIAQLGDVAPDFSLKNVDETMVSFSNYPEAKGFIVIFSCNHCPYVIAYEDRIIDLHKKYAPLGYPVIAINPNDPEVSKGDSFEDMKQRAQEKKFPFVYLFDEGQQVYPKYGATRTPHVFIVNKEKSGNIIRYIGTIDDNYENPDAVTKKYVENALDSLLAGKEISESKTVAIGCTIKTK